MQILYQKKPSEKALKNYKACLEKALEGNHIEIDIKLRENSNKFDESTDSQKNSETYCWIDKVNVKMGGDFLELEPTECHLIGIDEEPTPDTLWLMACEIQDSTYKKLGKKYSHPKSQDSYWKFLDYLDKKN